MLCYSRRFCFAHLVRCVDNRGFAGDFHRLHHLNAATTQRRVREAVSKDTNALFCGHHGTGKLTLLKAIGTHYEKMGKQVAYVSSDTQRANRMDGYLTPFFIGLRVSRDELPSQEQLEGTLERHVRLVESTYASSLPSLCNIDVLLIDALEKLHPTILLSMDAVARRLREKPNEPFGGLRVYAAADFWRLPVHPTSDTGGYLFQLPQWNSFFPSQELLRNSFVQEKALQRYTELALFGALTLEHMKDLEQRSMEGKAEAELLHLPSTTLRSVRGAGHSGKTTVEDDEEMDVGAVAVEEEDEGEFGDMDGVSPADGSSSTSSLLTSSLTLLSDDIISNAEAVTQFTQRFSRQPCIKVMPARYRQIKQTEIGNCLVNMLIQSSSPMSFGLVDALSIDVGSRVHLLLDAQKTYGVPGGAIGEVMQVKEHHLSIHFPCEHRTVDVPRMRIICYHPEYPELQYELQQFPVFPRQRTCPMNILAYPNTYHVNLNGRRMADTNDLGNLLAHQRSFADFTIRNTSDFAHLDGAVHEPTRIYYHEIGGKSLGTAKDQWCRNCKTFVPTDHFFDHWATCVRSVRWCNECSRTISLDLLEPHKEKHQVVLCMDCGVGVEWRHWEAHRLSCSAMMREISADNQFLPLRTRQMALELGLDKRDLHTMRAFSRSMLPKSKHQVH